MHDFDKAIIGLKKAVELTENNESQNESDRIFLVQTLFEAGRSEEALAGKNIIMTTFHTTL